MKMPHEAKRTTKRAKVQVAHVPQRQTGSVPGMRTKASMKRWNQLPQMNQEVGRAASRDGMTKIWSWSWGRTGRGMHLRPPSPILRSSGRSQLPLRGPATATRTCRSLWRACRGSGTTWLSTWRKGRRLVCKRSCTWSSFVATCSSVLWCYLTRRASCSVASSLPA